MASVPRAQSASRRPDLFRIVCARLPGVLRHGIANLYRPGNQAQAAVVALGVGVMFTLTVFLVQGALVEQIPGSAPPGTSASRSANSSSGSRE